jgi:hypothetical protein
MSIGGKFVRYIGSACCQCGRVIEHPQTFNVEKYSCCTCEHRICGNCFVARSDNVHLRANGLYYQDFPTPKALNDE